MRVRSLLLVVIGGIALGAPAASSSAAATAPVAIGPPDGVVHALAVAPSDPDRAYASGDGGLARSDDGGASWTWVGAAGIAPDADVAVSPDDADTLLGLGPQGIVQSVDGGSDWTVVEAAISASGGAAFAPSDGSVAYAALGGGSSTRIFASNDGGAGFVRVGTIADDVVSLVVDPSAPGTVYAMVRGGGVRRSTDGGATFDPMASGIAGHPLVVVTPDVAGGGRLFATTPRGVLVSGSGGSSWHRPATGITGSTAGEPIVQAGTRLLLLSSTGLWTSADAGANWSHVASAPLRFDAAAPAASGDTVVGPSTGAVARSANGGQVWTQTRLSTVYVTGLAVDPVRPLHVFATTVNGDHALWESSDGGGSWQPIDIASGVTAAFAVAIDPGNPSTIFVQQADGLYRSTDGGATWQPRTDTGRTQLEVNPQQPGTLYAGELVSHDGGGSWDVVGGSTPAGVTPLYAAVAPVSPAVVYLGTTGGLFSSTGGGAWQAVAPVGSGAVGAVAVNSADGGDVYAASGSQVFHRSDGSFSAVHPLPADVQALAVDPLHSGVVYASTGGGQDPALWRSADSGASWQQVGGGASGAQVPTLTVTPAGVLMAGTIGRGLFGAGSPVRRVPGAPVPRLVPGQQVDGHVPVQLAWSPVVGAGAYDVDVRTPSQHTIHVEAPRLLVRPMATRDVTARVRVPGGESGPGTTFRAGIGSEAWRSLRYAGAWSPVSAPDLWGGHARQSAQVGSSVRFAFTGRGVAWVATRGPSRGTARVYLDGALAGTVNLRSGERQTRVAAFVRNFSSTRTHSMGIVVTGGTVDIDGVTVLH